MKRGLLVFAMSAMAIAAVACGSDGNASGPTNTPAATSTPAATATVPPELFRMLEPGDDPAPPVGALDTSKAYIATIKTDKGDIVVELLDDIAPIYVENFVNLARIGYYDDTTFHRVLNDFMAQGGDPTGTGTGGPGYRFPDQFHPEMKHDRPGVLSMANSGLNTNGSQFFITHKATDWLDPYQDGQLKRCGQRDATGRPISCHGVFGRVTEGMDVLLSLTLRDPSESPGFLGDTLITVEIAES